MGRLAPQLYCAYHGWSFNADGSAAEIPSLRGSPEAMEKACGQPRASCTTFPVREAHGYVYVYAKPGPEAFVEAYAKELPFLPPWVSEDQVAAVMDLVQVYARDLPYSFDTLVENLAGEDADRVTARPGERSSSRSCSCNPVCTALDDPRRPRPRALRPPHDPGEPEQVPPAGLAPTGDLRGGLSDAGV